MTDSEFVQSAESKQSQPIQGLEDRPMDCCVKTIELLSKNNPMMVCQECKQMIKVFNDESEFRNYVKFCHSRHRTIATYKHQGLDVVIYKAYNSYGR